MSTELQDHAEQLAQFEAAEYWRAQYADLEDYYKPLRPVVKRYYSDDVEEGKVSISVAGVASANTAKPQGAIEQNGKR